MKLKTFLLIASAVFVLNGCGSKDENEDSKKSTSIFETKSNNEFTLNTIDGNTIDFEKQENGNWKIGEFKNKTILVTYFATWCPPCKAEIPHLINLKNQFKDSFEIIAILLEDGKTNEMMNSFKNEYGINYIITNGPSNVELSSVMGNVKTIPTSFLINSNGKIVQKYVGIVPQEMLASAITRAQIKEESK